MLRNEYRMRATPTGSLPRPEPLTELSIKRAHGEPVDAARVLAGTDCGFDTSAGRGRVSPDVVWAKLRAMREGAEIASDRLFR